MSNSSSLTMDHHVNPSPPSNCAGKAYNFNEIIDRPDFEKPCNFNENIEVSDFEISDFLMFEQSSDSEGDFMSKTGVVSPEYLTGASPQFSSSSSRIRNIKSENGVKKKVEVESRIAFITKSAVEIMDDGFKWRKYGKKKVKNNPNPRNYFKCSNGGCPVKKRVERVSQDDRYVLTTYEGVHNHESPCVVYYNETPLMIPGGFTLQPSNSAAHSTSS